MTPRCWDVGRSFAAAVTFGLLASACGPARVASPPEPEFVTGTRAVPTVVTLVDHPAAGAGDDFATELALDALDDAGLDDAGIDVSQMIVLDDAGNAAPSLSGWTAFDDSLSSQLIPADVSASVAVMVDGQIVHANAFGDRIAGSGDPAAPDDRFRIASISKTVTAIVTLQLVEDGVLSLDQPVGDLLVQHLGLPAADPDVSRITVRHLLSHTAGFPQHEGTFFRNGASSCIDAAGIGLSGSVSSPGSFRYSNMSYCVLGVLIEAVTGRIYEQVVYEQLLTPLGIGGMRMSSTYDLGPDEVSHHPFPNRNYMETLGAAGAWNATPSDLVTIMNSIDPDTTGWKALSDETLAIMRYQPSVAPVAAASPQGYGLGLINYDGDAYGHTGTIENTHAMVLVQPDGVTWALTVSGGYPSDTPVLRSIMRRAFATGFPAG